MNNRKVGEFDEARLNKSHKEKLQKHQGPVIQHPPCHAKAFVKQFAQFCGQPPSELHSGFHTVIT